MVDARRSAPLVGIAACLLVIVVLATPYVLTESQTAGLYYESGVVNPLLAGLLVVPAVVVFAAGRQGRTDRALAAGVTLTLGIFIVTITIAWASTVQFGIVDMSLASHRWALVTVAMGVPLAGTWYAHALGLLLGAEDAKGP
ncbi:DUF7548 family protein [Halapricum desulfuricans]|uniref:Putative membrane protein n=1 Tax=Halapricum desulfuricans TaxID=2841257 RepID=A0A897NN85_9EURY|nr:hypothetical protein [Halapricum desulfuricans]QSG13894.1 putative membrane protein [Halapricum desulfuricans]